MTPFVNGIYKRSGQAGTKYRLFCGSFNRQVLYAEWGPNERSGRVEPSWVHVCPDKLPVLMEMP